MKVVWLDKQLAAMMDAMRVVTLADWLGKMMGVSMVRRMVV